MSEIIDLEIKMKQLSQEISRLKAELSEAELCYKKLDQFAAELIVERDHLKAELAAVRELLKRMTEILEKGHSPFSHDLMGNEKRCERCKFIKLAKKSLSELESNWGPI